MKIIAKDTKESCFYIRTITSRDVETLRIWKNANRHSFFYQELISPEQQLKWYEGYRHRPDDNMFMVEEVLKDETEENRYHAIGCMAFRRKDAETVDLYNIIRGQRSRGTASMREAMSLMLNYIKLRFPGVRIKCDVLKDNPAVAWYEKCGLAIWKEKEYYIMGIAQKDIPDIEIEIIDEENQHD